MIPDCWEELNYQLCKALEIEKGVGNIRWAVLDAKTLNPSTELIEILDRIEHDAESLRLPPLPPQPAIPGMPLKLPETTVLGATLQDEVQLYRANWPMFVFQLELNYPNIRVAIHPLWLRRLLRHLVRNAIENMPNNEGRHVVVRIKLDGNLAEIQVEDNGIGVEPRLRKWIFNQPIPRQGRRGRGLLLTRHIAEYHGGKAVLLWSEIGKGSCFAVRLPIVKEGD